MNAIICNVESCMLLVSLILTRRGELFAAFALGQRCFAPKLNTDQHSWQQFTVLFFLNICFASSSVTVAWIFRAFSILCGHVSAVLRSFLREFTKGKIILSEFQWGEPAFKIYVPYIFSFSEENEPRWIFITLWSYHSYITDSSTYKDVSLGRWGKSIINCGSTIFCSSLRVFLSPFRMSYVFEGAFIAWPFSNTICGEL